MATHVWSAPQAAKHLRQALRDDDSGIPQALLLGLFKDAAAMCADNDLERIARAQGHVTRWQSMVASDSAAAEQLEPLAATLDAGWRTISLRRNAELQRAATSTVRERIVQFVQDNPGARPSAIAAGLQISPSQVSRAVSLLVEEGAIARDTTGGQDRRAVTYTPAPAAVAA